MVLAESGPVEGVGAGSEIPDPVEDPGTLGAAGAAGAGVGDDEKRHSLVRYSGHARGFPVSRVLLS